MLCWTLKKIIWKKFISHKYQIFFPYTSLSRSKWLINPHTCPGVASLSSSYPTIKSSRYMITIYAKKVPCLFLKKYAKHILYSLLTTVHNRSESLSVHFKYISRFYYNNAPTPPPPRKTKLECIGFTPSVRPSVRPASRVRSVAPTVLVGSISFLYLLSSEWRRCVACDVSCKF